MEEDHNIWRVWANYLQRWGVSRWVATLIEEAGPLTILGAQIIYIIQPLLENSSARAHWVAIGRVFDDFQYQRSFIRFLREESLP